MNEFQETPLEAVYRFPGRATRAVIDLDAISANVRELRQLLPPATKFMAVVKADGYGHGAVMVSRSSLAAGAEMLGVATVGEAADLRKHNIEAPILLLGPCDPGEVPRALELDVEVPFGSHSLLDGIAEAAEGTGRPANVHLKIDSGMHRFGAVPGDALALAERAASMPGVTLVGIFTHLASADDPRSAVTSEQLTVFQEAVSAIRAQIGRAVPTHVTNSAATISGLASGTDVARIGIAMYGLAPGPHRQLPINVRPALSLITRLARVHQPRTAAGVSYGHAYQSAAGERLGLLPIGYADGYRRALSDRAWVDVHGHKCPVRGRICMDQTVIGDLPGDVGVGDPAAIFGPLGGPSVDELAGMLGTINYEVAATVGARVPRYYLSGGRVVATLIEGSLDCY